MRADSDSLGSKGELTLELTLRVVGELHSPTECATEHRVPTIFGGILYENRTPRRSHCRRSLGWLCGASLHRVWTHSLGGSADPNDGAPGQHGDSLGLEPSGKPLNLGFTGRTVIDRV